jgi:hypothetical protein
MAEKLRNMWFNHTLVIIVSNYIVQLLVCIYMVISEN